jgi:tetratricopeptide (TPR) repeat protein
MHRVVAQEELSDSELTGSVLPLFAEPLSRLYIKCFGRYKRSGTLLDLHLAVLLSRLTIDCLPHDHARLPGYLSDHGFHLSSRFEHPDLRQLADIDEAIDVCRRSANLSPVDCAHEPARYYNLGFCLNLRFDRLGEQPDIKDAIAAHRRAIELVPEGHPKKPTYYNTLASSLRARFEILGEYVDLEDSVEAQRLSVQFTPDDDPFSKADRLAYLSRYYEIMFLQFGDVVDLKNAMATRRQSINLTPDDDISKPERLHTLALSLPSLFIKTGEPADIDDAIAAERRAVELAPRTELARYLIHLGSLLRSRYKHYSSLIDLNDAISTFRRAANLAPESAYHKSTLALSLMTRFERLGELVDVDDAIEAGRLAVKCTSDGHLTKPKRLVELGTALEARFRRLHDPHNIEEATSLQLRAVELATEDEPNKSMLFFTLASSWKTWLGLSRSPSHFESAYGHFQNAIHSSGPPQQKLQAALEIARMCSGFPELVTSEDVVLKAHRYVLEALPPILRPGYSISRRYIELSSLDISDAVTAAASAAIALGKYSLALEWLEEGRGMVWAQLGRLQNPLDELRQRDPELSDELERVSASLQSIGSTSDAAQTLSRLQLFMAREAQARRRYDLAKDHDILLARVRSIEGFESFLRPKTIRELSSACRDGPVAVINVNSLRCDALVLCPSGNIVHIPLPDFSLTKAKSIQISLAKCLDGRNVRLADDASRAFLPHQQVDNDSRMRHMLGILWICVVQPVLSSIREEVSIETRTARKLLTSFEPSC